jgi:glycoside hydrolase family 18
MAKRMKEKNERNKGKIVLNIIIVVIFLAIVSGVFYFSPNYIKEDYEGKTKILINNNNVTLKMKNDVYIDENNNVFMSMPDIKNYFDKYIEYDKEDGDIVTTSEINIAKLSTEKNTITINGEEEELNSSAIKKGETIYLPFSEISQKVYDVNLEYIKDTNTIIIDSLDRKQETATVNKNTKIKYKPQIFSRTLDKIKENEKVVFIEEKEDWAKVRTIDGTIGYIKKDKLNDLEVVREEKNYINKVDGKINLVWDYYSEYANAPDRKDEKMDGVNVVSPAFFSIMKGSNGEINDNAKEEGKAYIKWAHNNKYQVWAMFSNNSLKDTTSQILNDYEKRESMIENLISLVEKYDIDGVNVDFENMNESDKDVYSRFLIELAPRLKKMGKTLSVDVTAPDCSATWSLCFDRDVIADVSDYVIFMAYDQYGTGSSKAGTTAGYNWVEANIKKFLGQEDVPPEKLVLGIPLYMRTWEEKRDGTYVPNIVNMNDLFDVLPENQVATWDEDLKQYYVEYEKKGKKYKMWIENEKSIGEKINLAKKYNLAGIAFWEKDREPNTEFWTFVKEELN